VLTLSWKVDECKPLVHGGRGGGGGGGGALADVWSFSPTDEVGRCRLTL
jgi:hypothetical protein